MNLHLGSSILLGSLPSLYCSPIQWPNLLPNCVISNPLCPWFCNHRLQILLKGLFNYITQACICVYLLHIFKRMWDGFHISFHSLKKKMKGEWSVRRIAIYGLLHCKIKRFGHSWVRFLPRIQAQSPKACSCTCSLPDYVYTVILYLQYLTQY